MLAKIETAMAPLIGLDGHPLDFRTPRNWTALIARPSKEQDAADWLKNAGLLAYWPCFVDQIRHHQQRAAGRAKRFPRYKSVIVGYIFMAVRVGDNTDPWNIVRETPGIISFVRNAEGNAARMAEEDIAVIRRIEGGLNLPINPKTAHVFKCGDKVHFVDDLYGRWPNGVVFRLAENGRIIVNVPLLGQVVPIEVFPHQIEAM